MGVSDLKALQIATPKIKIYVYSERQDRMNLLNALLLDLEPGFTHKMHAALLTEWKVGFFLEHKLLQDFFHFISSL